MYTDNFWKDQDIICDFKFRIHGIKFSKKGLLTLKNTTYP